MTKLIEWKAKRILEKANAPKLFDFYYKQLTTIERTLEELGCDPILIDEVYKLGGEKVRIDLAFAKALSEGKITPTERIEAGIELKHLEDKVLSKVRRCLKRER